MVKVVTDLSGLRFDRLIVRERAPNLPKVTNSKRHVEVEA